MNTTDALVRVEQVTLDISLDPSAVTPLDRLTQFPELQVARSRLVNAGLDP